MLCNSHRVFIYSISFGKFLDIGMEQSSLNYSIISRYPNAIVEVDSPDNKVSDRDPRKPRRGFMAY